jgi:hypothetical protein
MAAISSQLLAGAVLSVQGMTFQQREKLADEVYMSK